MPFFSSIAFCGTFSDVDPPEHSDVVARKYLYRIILPRSHILYLRTLTHFLPPGEEKDRAHLCLGVMVNVMCVHVMEFRSNTKYTLSSR